MNAIEQTAKVEREIPDELALRLSQIADKKHQGEEFRRKDYFIIYLVGLVVPLIIMLAGWYL